MRVTKQNIVSLWYENKLNMRKILYTLVFVVLSIFLEAQPYTIEIEYIHNGKKIALKDNFEIILEINDSTQKTIIKPKITQNTFSIPNLCGAFQAGVFFKYKKTVIDLGYEMFLYDQNYKWKIVFNRKPYYDDKCKNIMEENLSQASEEYLKILKRTKAIVYVDHYPLEGGEETSMATTIPNVRQYFKENRRLLNKLLK